MTKTATKTTPKKKRATKAERELTAAKLAAQLAPRRVYKLTLTPGELVHIRDLFGLLIPPEAKKTLSAELAQKTDRVATEARAWEKISALCTQAGVPVGETAPDYVVSISSTPEVSVFMLEQPQPAGADSASSGECDADDCECEGVAALAAALAADEAAAPAGKRARARKPGSKKGK